jgi:6-phosphofructokinase 1
VVLIPEIPYDIERVCEKIRERDRTGRHFSIVVAAEGAFPRGGSPYTIDRSSLGMEPRLGGVAEAVARAIEQRTGKETRSLVLGHLQRGGQPTGYDRLRAARFGGAAVVTVSNARWGHMVALQSPHIVPIPIVEALSRAKRVDLDYDVVQTGRATGISFGD